MAETEKQQSFILKQVAPGIVRTFDYYNYAAELQRRLIRTHDIRNILQVEFQPGSHCDLYRCPYCYGVGQKQKQGLLKTEEYLKILDELKDKIPLIQISGVKTEPLVYDDIVEILKRIIKNKFGYGIHTKGYRLNDQIIDLLTNPDNERESFITISLDAADKKDYMVVHGLKPGEKDDLGNLTDDYYNIVINNIHKLYEKKVEKSSNLRINITCLLFNLNSEMQKIHKLVKDIHNHCDVIRFSLPHTPNNNKNTPESFLDKQSGSDILQTIKNEKFEDNPLIKVLDFEDSKHNTSYKYCFAQVFQIVVDKAGNVFPCPQTALAEYDALCFGNIRKTDGFLLPLLKEPKRIDMISRDIDTQLKCRICDRKDESCNEKINTLFETWKEV